MRYLEEGYWVDDGTGAEVEVRQFLEALVYVNKPRLIVETGCYDGRTAEVLGMAAAANGGGLRVVSCDVDASHVEQARLRCAGLPVEVRHCPSSELPELRQADLLFCDSEYAERVLEVHHAKPGALVVVHDTKACLSEGVDLGQLVLDQGGILFDTHRGFGMLRKQL